MMLAPMTKVWWWWWYKEKDVNNVFREAKDRCNASCNSVYWLFLGMRFYGRLKLRLVLSLKTAPTV